MGRQAHFAQAAERKANEPAFRFMSSSDVVGDMSRAYGAAERSSGRAHTGGSAVTRSAPAGAAQGGLIDWFRSHFTAKGRAARRAKRMTPEQIPNRYRRPGPDR